MTFNPNEHLMKLQGKDYLQVKWRLVWFNEATTPRAGYITVEKEHDRQNGFAKFFTIAWDGNDETWRHMVINGVELEVCGRVATGEGSETIGDHKDYYEKSATKSLGRALAGLGYGTQFSAEMDEGGRVVDSPVERKGQPPRQAAALHDLKATASGGDIAQFKRECEDAGVTWREMVIWLPAHRQGKTVNQLTYGDLAELREMLKQDRNQFVQEG